MGRRLRVTCALWLIALVILPFTPPFPTYDLGALSGSGAGTHPLPAPISRAPALADPATAVVPTLITEEGRLRLVLYAERLERIPADLVPRVRTDRSVRGQSDGRFLAIPLVLRL
jgi:hypothetical protein